MKGKKGIVLLLLVGLMILSLPFSSFADEADSKLQNFIGTYRGSYYANQGHTGLTLKVYLDEDSNYKASFYFYSVPENPSVPSGEYICDVRYDEINDEYIVIGREWVNKPYGYIFVDLYGKYDNYTYTGKVDNGSWTFHLIKQVEENEPSKWAKDTVDNAVIEGIVPLELQGNYKDPITRAEFTRLMIAAIGKHTGKDMEEILNEKGIHLNKNVFEDTEDKFVLAAYSLNIIEGYGNGKFGPQDLLTREQAAKILRNMVNLLGVDSTTRGKISFKDEHKFSSWAKEHIEFITSCYIEELGISIMEGDGANFDPLGNYTKEQSYLTVYRLLKYVK